MKLLHAVLQDVAGLFVEDRYLAAGVLLLVGSIALLVELFDGSRLLAGGVLAVGSVAILLGSVWHEWARRRRADA